ncbi:topoisomerase 3-alpha [Colletes latitarsis]|uniref:topoisomerase 3-alpha n=1 Tax=Colletes latitarsis TaxID=2605962 RepID=UPI004036B1EB
MLINFTKLFDNVLLNSFKSTQYRFLKDTHSSIKVMKILNVAEKNDAAKNIASYLSRGASRRKEGLSPYNKIYEFSCYLWNQNCDMIMTSVSGHLLNHEFVGSYRKWQGCHPLSLFDAPVVKTCLEENYMKIKKTLEREVKKCSALIIWTDCDREGENIGFEIIQVCQAVKPNIQVYRAKFSEITQASVDRALQNVCEPDKAISDAVDVRSELDLRIGAAFTRFQTLRLQKVFPRSLADMLISYGSCQFPTLGFVVERFLAIERFKSEPYWKIKVMDVRDELSVEFRWMRGRLFEKLPCEVLLDTCLEQPNATVQRIISKQKNKWRPLPLDTVELEKQGSRKLHLNAKETMKIAEKLYTQGLISYPRTETNIFPKELNLVPLVNQQINNSAWGNFAQRLIEMGVSPRQGKKSDQAHPPIHPTKYADNLQGNEAKVYEFVVRHFLACLSKDALGQETTVEINIAGEKFIANGLQIIERNYLDVYIYEKWSDKEIHMYQEGQVFSPTSIDMVQEETSPPRLLTEADLISLMDKFGIGTDATHAEHIDTIKSRQYVGLTDGKYLMPGKLGIGLVMGYDNMGFQMSKPNLRADLEKDLKLICDRQKDPKEVLQTQINKYRDVFKVATERANLIDNALADYLNEQPMEAEEVQITVPSEQVIFKCPKCKLNMVLRDRKQGTGKYIGCMGYPTCNNAIWFPQTVESVEVLDEVCSECSGNMHKLKLKLSRNAFPMYGTSYTTCIGGCDPSFNELLNIRNESIKITNRSNDTGYDSMFDGSRSTVLSNPRTVRNNDIRQPPVENRTNLSNNNTSIGVVQSQNRGRNNTSRSRNNNTNTKKRKNSRNDDTWLDSSNFTSSSTNVNLPSTQQNTAWGDIDRDAVIVCKCHENAIQLTVKKDGPNHGRLFYKCAKPQGTGCDFFLWASDSAQETQNNISRNSNHTQIANTSSRPSTSVATSNTRGHFNTSTSLTDIKCHCNQLAKERTVQKDGPNKGRLFYSCPKPMNESCKFFQWVDEDSSNHNQTFGERNSNTSRGKGHATRKNVQRKPRATGGKRKCGNCGMEGHTRKTCQENVMD